MPLRHATLRNEGPKQRRRRHRETAASREQTPRLRRAQRCTRHTRVAIASFASRDPGATSAGPRRNQEHHPPQTTATSGTPRRGGRSGPKHEAATPTINGSASTRSTRHAVRPGHAKHATAVVGQGPHGGKHTQGEGQPSSDSFMGLLTGDGPKGQTSDRGVFPNTKESGWARPATNRKIQRRPGANGAHALTEADLCQASGLGPAPLWSSPRKSVIKAMGAAVTQGGDAEEVRQNWHRTKMGADQHR